MTTLPKRISLALSMKNTGTIWPKVRSEEIVVWNFFEAFSHQRLSWIKASEFLRILVRLHSKIPHIPLYLLSKAALKTHHGLKFKLQKEDRSVALTIVTLKGSGKNLSLLFYFLVALYVAQFTTLISASVFTWLFFSLPLFCSEKNISIECGQCQFLFCFFNKIPWSSQLI